MSLDCCQRKSLPLNFGFQQDRQFLLRLFFLRKVLKPSLESDFSNWFYSHNWLNNFWMLSLWPHLYNVFCWMTYNSVVDLVSSFRWTIMLNGYALGRFRGSSVSAAQSTRGYSIYPGLLHLSKKLALQAYLASCVFCRVLERKNVRVAFCCFLFFFSWLQRTLVLNRQYVSITGSFCFPLSQRCNRAVILSPVILLHSDRYYIQSSMVSSRQSIAHPT